MINHIIIYSLVFVAGLFNAAMDTLKDHYSSSIWWDKTVFWPTQKDANGNKFLGMVWDGWHIAKTAMLLLLLFAVALNKDLYWWEYFTLYFFAWGGGFGLGYNWLFKKK